MLPLWSFRNDGASVELSVEIMEHMQAICVEYLSGRIMDSAQKLKAIFLMGGLIGYYWDIGGEDFCAAFLDVFDEANLA